MLENNNPEINITEVLEKVALELKLQQDRKAREPRQAAPDKLNINDPYRWHQLSETLHMAELNVNAGAEVTSMLHYRGIVKKVARLLGKITIFLGRVITIPQRNFNSAILHSLRITLDGIRDMNRNSAALEKQVNRLTEKAAMVDHLKTSLVTQERRVSILLEELRSRVAAAGDGGKSPPPGASAPDILDPLYVAFENQFRGTREEIRERLKEYIPLVREAGAGSEDREILDIGCGRGEWLEIMRDEGLKAAGLDLNHVLVRECREKGLTVLENDALSHLRSLPDNSLGAITAFHLIEHLEFDDRIALFDECVRVLRSGGLAVFETPNPRNLLVGACNFWSDPTHLRPLYPETQQFLMECRGFCKVRLLFLHPHEGDQRLPEEEAPQLAARLNEVLACARDYAVIGYKV